MNNIKAHKKQLIKHQFILKNHIGLLLIIRENLYMAKISFAPSEGWMAVLALLGGLKPQAGQEIEIQYVGN